MAKTLDKAKLIKVLGRMGSMFEPEQLTALRMAHAMITQSGLTWEELLAGGGKSTPNTEQLRKAKAAGYQQGLAEGARQEREGYAKALQEAERKGREAGLAEARAAAVAEAQQARPFDETIYWKDFVRVALETVYPHMTEWEQEFLQSIDRFYSVSDKQFAVLERMAAKHAGVALQR